MAARGETAARVARIRRSLASAPDVTATTSISPKGLQQLLDDLRFLLGLHDAARVESFLHGMASVARPGPYLDKLALDLATLRNAGGL